MTEEKRKRLTTVETVEAVLNTTREFIGQRIDNLKEDIGETNNLIHDYPEIAMEMKAALAKIILDGRSTTGEPQENEEMDGWAQIESIFN